MIDRIDTSGLDLTYEQSLRRKGYTWAFFIFCICGIVGLSPDLDHLEGFLLHKVSLVQENLVGRTSHISLLIFAVLVLCYLYTYIHRLELLVLEEEELARYGMLIRRK